MTGEEFDKVCSCGEAIKFVENKVTGNLVPICKAHGMNHFLCCPNRERYRRVYGTPQNQQSLEAFR